MLNLFSFSFRNDKKMVARWKPSSAHKTSTSTFQVAKLPTQQVSSFLDDEQRSDCLLSLSISSFFLFCCSAFQFLTFYEQFESNAVVMRSFIGSFGFLRIPHRILQGSLKFLRVLQASSEFLMISQSSIGPLRISEDSIEFLK